MHSICSNLDTTIRYSIFLNISLISASVQLFSHYLMMFKFSSINPILLVAFDEEILKNFIYRTFYELYSVLFFFLEEIESIVCPYSTCGTLYFFVCQMMSFGINFFFQIAVYFGFYLLYFF